MYAAYITGRANPGNKFRVLVKSRAEAQEKAASIPYAEKKIVMIKLGKVPEPGQTLLQPKPGKRKTEAPRWRTFSVSLHFENIVDVGKSREQKRIRRESVNAPSFCAAAIKAYTEVTRLMPLAAAADVIVTKNKEYRRFMVWKDHAERYPRRFSAARLADLMNERGVTVKRIAQLTSFYPQTINNWLKGKGKPAPFDLAALCEVLGVPMVYLEANKAEPIGKMKGGE